MGVVDGGGPTKSLDPCGKKEQSFVRSDSVNESGPLIDERGWVRARVSHSGRTSQEIM